MTNNERLDYDLCLDFQKTFNHPVGDTKNPSMSKEDVPDKVLELRMDLVAEEFFELIEAAYGPEPANAMKNLWESLDGKKRREDGEYSRDLIETVDAIGDLLVVLNGFGIVLGAYMPNVMKEIYDSNMSKLDENGDPIYNEKGKITKGPNYFRPDISGHMKEN